MKTGDLVIPAKDIRWFCRYRWHTAGGVSSWMGIIVDVDTDGRCDVMWNAEGSDNLVLNHPQLELEAVSCK
tara:strand:- start:41 stop:253 length:213 start_codon:yes stop_codon:yes gene_type:complete